MIKITYVEYNGCEHNVEAEPGATVMATAIDNGVPGIDADCGGACSCGTCHVIVDQAWFDQLGAARAEEEGLLGFVPERAGSSRLSCQITLNETHDGLTVRLPEYQM